MIALLLISAYYLSTLDIEQGQKEARDYHKNNPDETKMMIVAMEEAITSSGVSLSEVDGM